MLTYLRRGLLAGAVGGLLAGAFGFLLAEPLMDRAVRLEAARRAAAGDHSTDLFDRSTQHAGFLVAYLAVGLALGVLYGVVYGLVHRSAPADGWGSALRLGGAGFFALALVPFVRYPANPPGVGDAGTIATRTHGYELSLVIGLVGVCVAALVALNLRESGARASSRQLAATGVLAATIGLTFVLPANTDAIEVPVHLIWDFRLLWCATTLLLWGGLAATFGLLSERRQPVG